jgi:hypothetical protein
MRRALASAVLLLCLGGCSYNCHDGSSGVGVGIGPVGMSSSSYRSCKFECCRPEEPKPCGCSNACPCWRQHP